MCLVAAGPLQINESLVSRQREHCSASRARMTSAARRVAVTFPMARFCFHHVIILHFVTLTDFYFVFAIKKYIKKVIFFRRHPGM